VRDLDRIDQALILALVMCALVIGACGVVGLLGGLGVLS
jgi:hypothetical protein